MIACDLGSNTFRVVEIDCDTKQRVNEFERVVRTADGLIGSKIISQDAVKRVIEAIKDAKRIFDLSSSKAVATAAMRKAENREEVLQIIKEQTGLEIEVITSRQEADYIRIAVEKQLNVKDYILMDLGGGSTELIFDNSSISLDIGIVTLVDKYSDIKEGIQNEFTDIYKLADSMKQKPSHFIATAGTPTTIASLILGMDYKNYDYKKVNGFKLTLKDLNDVLGKLIAMSEAEKIRWVGIGREDLIISGVLMFKEIVEIFGFSEVTVIDDGLREGVALSIC